MCCAKQKIYITKLGLDCINDDAKSNKSESEIESRIRESEDSCQVKPHSKPWVVRLTINGVFVCGGTLIGKKTVVTAAHCYPHDVTTVIIGDHHRTGTDCDDGIENDENEQCIGVKFAEVHKKFDSKYSIVVMYFVLFLLKYIASGTLSLNHVSQIKRLVP